MDIFKDINVDDIRKDYVDGVRYCQRYLNFESLTQIGVNKI